MGSSSQSNRKSGYLMSNPEKKLSSCCGAEIRLSDVFINGVVPKMWCQKCNNPCKPKPSTSQSCEHPKHGTLEKLRGVCDDCHKPTAVEPSVEEKKNNCNVCGSALVSIRGKYPNQPKRFVCATCTYERLEQIREISDKNYGVAYEC